MNAPAHISRIIVLFDEFGTPTFRADRPINSFLGVSVTYKSDDEHHIFQQCDTEFGLSNVRPLKNDRISESRAEKISKLISALPVHITISSLDLSNEDLKRVVGLYEELGGEIRRLHRGVGQRVAAHILHDQILDDTLFSAISRYLEDSPANQYFEIFIDDWAIPMSDIEVALDVRSKSFKEKINELHIKFGLATALGVSPIKRMAQDSVRKRFIDVVTSSISRSFLPPENPRFSPIPLQNILGYKYNASVDITDNTIRFLHKAMDEFSRNPGP